MRKATKAHHDVEVLARPVDAVDTQRFQVRLGAQGITYR